MNFPPCFATYNNIDYQQRSQTLQPNTGREFLLNKYFSLMSSGNGADSGDIGGSNGIPPSERQMANYENVHVNQDEPLPILSPANQYSHHHHHQQQQHSRHHHHQSGTMRPPQQHFHTRSQSQHHYHTMYQSDLNNYYNLNTNSNPPIKSSPGIRPISLEDRPPPPPMSHNPVSNIDPVTIMQVLCNDLGHNIDSAPPEPCARNYSIVRTRDGLIKVGFPQIRKLKVDFMEPKSKTIIKAGEIITVLGLSKHNKSLCLDRPDMFYACYNDQLTFDIEHHLTTSPQIKGPWP